MSRVDFVDFGLPHEYSCEVSREPVDAVPGIRIPREPLRAAEDYIYVRVSPDGGGAWTAAVLREFGDGLLDGVVATAEPAHACVVSGGGVYVIDSRNPEAWRWLDAVIPGVAAFGSPEDALLFLASFNRVFAINADLDIAWSTDLESDGIEFTAIADGILSVRAYMPGYQDWLSRAIVVSDGKVLSE